MPMNLFRSKILTLIALTVCLAAPLGAAEQPAGRATKKVTRQRQQKTEPSDLKPSRIVIFKTIGETKLGLHVFEPEGFKPGDQRPCFVAIHGGGWVSGDAERFYKFADHFAKLGYVGISVEYRLLSKTNGVTVYDCVKDGRSAIRYLRQHAAELGIDPHHIAVCGGSAGGHVAASTALFDDINEAGDDAKISCVPDALVLYFPVIDTSTEGYGNAKCGEKWQELSPLHRVKPGLPPTIVFHGTADTTTPFKGAKAFDEAMRKAGNRCELVVNEGGKHGYLMPSPKPELFNEAMRRTEEFLKSLGWPVANSN